MLTRRRRTCLAVVAVLVAGLVVACQPGSTTLTVTTPASYQFTDGWGTSLAWWANAVGQSTTLLRDRQGTPVDWSATRGQLLHMLFDPPATTPDSLGLTVARYNIGATPVPPTLWQPPDVTDCAASRSQPCCPNSSFGFAKNMPLLMYKLSDGYAPARVEDARQLWVLQQAIQDAGASNMTLEAFANSPPPWLVHNGCTAGTPDHSRALVDDPAVYTEYVSYLMAVLDYLRGQGFRVSTVEPFNEPSGGPPDGPWWYNPACIGSNNCQEGANIPIAQQDKTITLLCRALHDANSPIRISAADENSVDQEISTLTRYSAQSRHCLGQLNTHGYSGTAPYTGTKRGDLLQMAGRTTHGEGGRKLWMSEYGIGNADTQKRTGDLGEVSLAFEIAHDLRDLRPNAWVYWQVIDRAWGLWTNCPATPMTNTEQLATHRTPRFWELWQYSHFIRPGDRIYPLQSGDQTGTDPRTDHRATVVARSDNGTGNRVTVVVTNRDSGDPWTVDLSAILPGTGWRLAEQHRTINGEHYQPVNATFHDSTLSDSLPSDSVTTYVLTRPAAATPARPRACPPNADILAAARRADPSVADFATVSDSYCQADQVAAWIDQSAEGLAVLEQRQGTTLRVEAIGDNVCNDPAVTRAAPPIRQFFNC